MIQQHHQRKHSKYSASGAERWFNCPGSVTLSEGIPDKDTIWSKEGTTAHELLEKILRKSGAEFFKYPKEMVAYVSDAARFILNTHQKRPSSEYLVEDRIHLEFIHPEMFGTYDAVVLEPFGDLDVFDFKYGAGHAVSPTKNLQMIFYGLGVAHKYNWEFQRVRLWIIQPRIKGYDGPVFWELKIEELRAYISQFERAVERVEKNPEKYVEGPWCWFCKAKTVCPLKRNQNLEMAKQIFKPITGKAT